VPAGLRDSELAQQAREGSPVQQAESTWHLASDIRSAPPQM